jgi:hypothetical protein
MAFQTLANAVRFNATLAGLADFVVASAVAGHSTPEQASVTDGKIYTYYAQSADGTQWEAGTGAYAIATHTLPRTAISGTSNGDQNKLNFTTIPIVDVFPSPPSSLEPNGIGAFPSGTLMTFQQSTAPIFWTKITTFNDAVLRVVSGTASSGGSNTFSSVNAQTVVGGHSEVVAESAPHNHTDNESTGSALFASATCPAQLYALPSGPALTGASGSGVAHNHAIAFSIKYVDVIIAQKN